MSIGRSVSLKSWDDFGILSEGWGSGVRLRELSLVLMHDYDVSNSKLLAMVEIDDNASFGAATNGRLAEVSCSAALATMDKESASATHLLRLLRIQVERAWACYGRVVHGILAIT